MACAVFLLVVAGVFIQQPAIAVETAGEAARSGMIVPLDNPSPAVEDPEQQSSDGEAVSVSRSGAGKLDTRKSEARSQKPEARSQKPEEKPLCL